MNQLITAAKHQNWLLLWLCLKQDLKQLHITHQCCVDVEDTVHQTERKAYMAGEELPLLNAANQPPKKSLDCRKRTLPRHPTQ